VESGDLTVAAGAMLKLVRTATVGLLVAAPMGAGVCAAAEANRVAAPAPTLTSKERLGGKASDEQRVDNCKVPPELRGPKPRPDDCSEGTVTGAKR
jgi:hypothetical protein